MDSLGFVLCGHAYQGDRLDTRVGRSADRLCGRGLHGHLPDLCDAVSATSSEVGKHQKPTGGFASRTRPLVFLYVNFLYASGSSGVVVAFSSSSVTSSSLSSAATSSTTIVPNSSAFTWLW